MFTFEKNNKTRGHYPQLGNLLPGVESGSHKSHPDFTTKRRHVIKATGAVKNKLLYRSGSVFFAGGLSWIRTLFFKKKTKRFSLHESSFSNTCSQQLEPRVEMLGNVSKVESFVRSECISELYASLPQCLCSRCLFTRRRVDSIV